MPASLHTASSSLADHDADSLARHLDAATGCGVARGKRAAERAFRHAFANDASGGARWSDGALAEAGIGAWARPTLVALSPRIGLTVHDRAPSSDGTVRLLLQAQDGGLIESVIIPAEEGRDALRTTLCLSSQVGCARACRFCETGDHGLTRHLTPGEIVDQYRLVQRICSDPDRPMDARVDAPRPLPPADRPGHRRRAAERPVSNIVFMGMGEPFDNLEAVLRSVELLTDPHAFGFAPTRITVSTVGVADKLTTFFAGTRAELAISLNAPDDARRDHIMPINRRFDLAALRDALLAAMPAGRRVLFQYALFDGFNDSLADAELLADYVAPVRCRVNVIPANPGPDPSLVAPPPERVDAFVAHLRARGVTALVRRPRGRDIGGACGQLAGRARLVTLRSPGDRSPQASS